MNKIELENQPFIYPMPVVIVGAEVEGKPNYMTAAWVTPVNFKPVMIGVTLGKSHYTCKGIREHGEFSLSIPSQDQMRAVDYVGLVSGNKADKSEVFEAFYGELKHAPMVKECPLTMECRVTEVVSLKVDDLFIAEMAGVYCSDDCLTGGEIDIAKARPFVFTMPDKGYWSLGEKIGTGWESGKGYR